MFSRAASACGLREAVRELTLVKLILTEEASANV
jgi:hypothetical protein